MASHSARARSHRCPFAWPLLLSLVPYLLLLPRIWPIVRKHHGDPKQLIPAAGRNVQLHLVSIVQQADDKAREAPAYPRNAGDRGHQAGALLREMIGLQPDP